MPPLISDPALKRPHSPTESMHSYASLPSPPPLTPVVRSRSTSECSLMSTDDPCAPASMVSASTAAVLFDYTQPRVAGSMSAHDSTGDDSDGDEVATPTSKFDPIESCATAQQILSEVDPTPSTESLVAYKRPDSISQQFGQLLSRQPNMPLTIEEKGFAQQLLQIELETSRSIPVPPDTMGKIINAARSGTVIPIDAAIQGYTICMERVIKFATQIDLFKR